MSVSLNDTVKTFVFWVKVGPIHYVGFVKEKDKIKAECLIREKFKPYVVADLRIEENSIDSFQAFLINRESIKDVIK